jgi:hypothetical protein
MKNKNKKILKAFGDRSHKVAERESHLASLGYKENIGSPDKEN